MKPCFAIEITTPKQYQLTGLWFGPARAKRVIVFVHGLAGSAMNQRSLVYPWVDANTAVMTFGNRGHDKVTKIRRIARNKKGYVSVLAGEAHEVFTDCVDDLQGAVGFAKRAGAREIYLAGHSTGCQKSVYYASKKPDRAVSGLILLAPMSDYADAAKFQKAGNLAKATAVARAMIRAGKKHELMPRSVWDDVLDAQRFLSLYTPDSAEEIFSYAQPKKDPVTLKKVKLPLLVIFAGEDEFEDRPTEDIADWFEGHINEQSTVAIIPGVLHSFVGGEEKTASVVRDWLG